MLKKIFLILIIFFGFLQLTCEAKSQYSNVLSKMEKSMFNMVYDKQSDELRLNRIEENVYGSTSHAQISQRINKLSKDLSVEVIGQEIVPKKDSFLRDNEIITDDNNADMDFSVVNNLEKKVFQYEFKTIDVNNRLSALESQVLKRCYLQDDLNTRINRLKCVVFYNKIPDEKIVTKIVPNLRQKAIIASDAKEETPAINIILREEKMSDDSKIKLVTLEKTLFNKSFSDENNSTRLTRLETSILKSTFPGEENESRLIRIESVREAQKSEKKYKSNHASKYTATSIQVGTMLLMLLPFLLL